MKITIPFVVCGCKGIYILSDSQTFSMIFLIKCLKFNFSVKKLSFFYYALIVFATFANVFKILINFSTIFKTRMKKKLLLTMLVSTVMATASAENNWPSWINNFKVSGYIMSQYQYSSQENATSNSFNIRMGRLIIDAAPLKNWVARVQFQYNGNTTNLGSSFRMVDAYAEWQKYEFMRVKIGQFKRAFTLENPMNPINQGFMSFGQNVNKLASFVDRNGAHSSNGRDIGIQLQGDFLKNSSGRNLMHYQVAVYNGQGINTKDVDHQKDIVGGVWVMPIKGMRLALFGSEGTYARKDPHTGLVKLPQHRYAISGEYAANDWTFRSEYIHSTGQAFKKTYQKSEDLNDATINTALGNKADGVYALVIAPIIKNKLHVKARYDTYRESATWNTARTQYEIGADYMLGKNLQINLEWALVNDKSLANRAKSNKHNYNIIDAELDFRF